MKKYKVLKEMHIRQFGPRLSDNIAGILKPDYLIEAVEVLEGDFYDNSNLWIRDHNNFFYWMGALAEILDDTPVTANYNQLVKLKDNAVSQTCGAGVVIAILDSGCALHPYLNNSFAGGYNAITDQEGLQYCMDFSYVGHGTKIAGTIGARGVNTAIKGVAPDVQLIIVKTQENRSTNIEAVKRGLYWLLNDSPVKPDVINLSFDLMYDHHSELTGIFDQLQTSGISVFAAAGEGSMLFENSAIYYPASDKNVLAVGQIDFTTSIPEQQRFNSEINFFTPKFSFQTLTKYAGYYENDEGSSYATAIISGVAALCLSYIRQKNITVDLLEFMNTQILPIDFNSDNKSLKIFKK